VRLASSSASCAEQRFARVRAPTAASPPRWLSTDEDRGAAPRVAARASNTASVSLPSVAHGPMVSAQLIISNVANYGGDARSRSITRRPHEPPSMSSPQFFAPRRRRIFSLPSRPVQGPAASRCSRKLYGASPTKTRCSARGRSARSRLERIASAPRVLLGFAVGVGRRLAAACRGRHVGGPRRTIRLKLLERGKLTQRLGTALARPGRRVLRRPQLCTNDMLSKGAARDRSARAASTRVSRSSCPSHRSPSPTRAWCSSFFALNPR